MSTKARSEVLSSHPSIRLNSAPLPYLGDGPLAKRPDHAEAGLVVDWRTREPETIRGEDLPVKELRFYREKIDELLRDGKGKYVVIAGREIITYCSTLEAAVEVSRSNLTCKRPLIKKVVATEPVNVLRSIVG